MAYQMKSSPAKLFWALKAGSKLYNKARKIFKGKPISISKEVNNAGKTTQKTVEYKKSADRVFYNTDGTVNRKIKIKK